MKQADIVPMSFIATTALDEALAAAYRAGRDREKGIARHPDEEYPNADAVFAQIMEIMEVSV